MKRFLVWASPVIGILLGMAGILIFRNQLPAGAYELRTPEQVLQTRPDTARQAPAVEPAEPAREPAVAGH